jgi:hypothetical protein
MMTFSPQKDQDATETDTKQSSPRSPRPLQFVPNRAFFRNSEIHPIPLSSNWLGRIYHPQKGPERPSFFAPRPFYYSPRPFWTSALPFSSAFFLLSHIPNPKSAGASLRAHLCSSAVSSLPLREAIPAPALLARRTSRLRPGGGTRTNRPCIPAISQRRLTTRRTTTIVGD